MGVPINRDICLNCTNDNNGPSLTSNEANNSVTLNAYQAGQNQKWRLEPSDNDNYLLRTMDGRYFSKNPGNDVPVLSSNPFPLEARYDERTQGIKLGTAQESLIFDPVTGTTPIFVLRSEADSSTWSIKFP